MKIEFFYKLHLTGYATRLEKWTSLGSIEVDERLYPILPGTELFTANGVPWGKIVYGENQAHCFKEERSPFSFTELESFWLDQSLPLLVARWEFNANLGDQRDE